MDAFDDFAYESSDDEYDEELFNQKDAPISEKDSDLNENSIFRKPSEVAEDVEFINKDNKHMQNSILRQSPEIIEDDPNFEQKEADFKANLKILIQEAGSISSLISKSKISSTIEEIDYKELSMVWNFLNSERNNQTNFKIGEKTNIERGILQLCNGSRWFDITLMNLAFLNIQFRANLIGKKIIALSTEFSYLLQVIFHHKKRFFYYS